MVHANHPHEIVSDCDQALRSLVRSGITVLNQAVLCYAGLTRRSAVQTELCERLVDVGVIPYYLHQLDRVSGTAHFEVPVEAGRKLIDQLRRRLPGYATPEYVREEPGQDHKIPLTFRD